VLDALAYWATAGWNEDEFFHYVGFRREELLGRYTGVIHLQSTAVGAEPFYRSWPEAHRPETIEQAAKIDAFCIRAWHGHRRHVIIENRDRPWSDKSEACANILANWLLPRGPLTTDRNP